MIRIADLFCGAGGATTGVHMAAQTMGLSLDVVAINHWPVAVETHARNYPDATHLCMGVEAVDPRQAVPGGHLHLLVAGVECTHHSNARGGRPMNDQSRASAWNVLRWCELLRVDHVLIENVPEFRSWGPLDSKMRPIASRRGETYRAFLAALESFGYTVEARILNAADYGDATTRKRLFIQARRGPIAWPEPTHGKLGGASLLRTSAPWRPARDVIDWSLPSQPIDQRKRPLSPNTLRRIDAGLRRFGGHPFMLGQQSCSAPRGTADPVPTIATAGAVSLVEPFLVPFYGEASGQAPRTHAVSEPVPTIPASAAKFGLVEPFIVGYHTERGGETARVHPLGEPLPTLTTENRFGLVEPFVVQVTHGGRLHSVADPLPTIPAGHRGEMALVEPFTLPYCSNGAALARPVSEPLGTVTTRDRFALVIPDGMGIRFRMLQPHELAAAMGFPAGYQFAGTKTDIIRQIGNAWACHTATALCRTILARYATRPATEAVA